MIEKCTNLNLFVGCLFIILSLITMPSNQEGTTPSDGTTVDDEEKTDIPQKDIDDALILDYGQYTTMQYHYAVNQWIHHQEYYPWIGEGVTDERLEMCYHQYLKCATSLEAPVVVCAFYTQLWDSGFKTVDTYCDAYFENCRIGYQYWRLISYGKCDLGRFFGWDEIIEY